MSFLLLLSLIILILGNDVNVETNTETNQTEANNQKLIAELTSCWVISIQELSESQNIINQFIINQQDKITRDNVFYKIQTTMLEQCISEASKEELEIVMKSIQEDTKQYKSFKQIIPTFNYNQFNTTTFDWQLTQTDQTLMKYIRRFEEWISRQQITAQPKVANNTKESVFSELKQRLVQMSRQAKENDTGKQEQLEKIKFYSDKQKSMKDPMNYVYAIVIVVILLTTFLFIYQKVKNANVDPRLQKKKQKSKKE